MPAVLFVPFALLPFRLVLPFARLLFFLGGGESWNSMEGDLSLGFGGGAEEVEGL